MDGLSEYATLILGGDVLDPSSVRLENLDMHIKKGASIAVVLKRDWSNLAGVRLFLRQNENPRLEIAGADNSHIVFAKLLDSEDLRGLWIELNTDQHETDPSVERYSFLVPWDQVLTIIVQEEFSPEIREEARKIGFTEQVRSKA